MANYEPSLICDAGEGLARGAEAEGGSTDSEQTHFIIATSV